MEDALSSETPSSCHTSKKKKECSSNKNYLHDNIETNHDGTQGTSLVKGTQGTSLVKGTLLEPPVNISMMLAPTTDEEATTLETPASAHRKLEPTSEKKKKRKKRRRTQDCKEEEEKTLETCASEGHLLSQSVVHIDRETNSKHPSEFQASTVSVISKELAPSSRRKRKRKGSKSQNPAITNIDHENLNGTNIEHENLIGFTLETTATEREQQIQKGLPQISDERRTNSEKLTPNADQSCSEEKRGKNYWKKRKKLLKKQQARQQNAQESNDRVGEFLEENVKENVVFNKIESVQPSVKGSSGTETKAEQHYAKCSLSMERRDDKEQNKMYDASAIAQNVATPSQSVGDAKHLGKDYRNFLSETMELNSTDTKENSLITEERSGFSNGVNTESRKIETYKRRKRNRCSKIKKSSVSGDIMQTLEDADVGNNSSSFLVEANTSRLLENMSRRSSSVVEAVSKQFHDIVTGKDSVKRSDIESAIQEREKVMKINPLGVTNHINSYLNDASELEGGYERKNGEKLVMRDDAFKIDDNPCCKENISSDLLKLDPVEVEITREEVFSLRSGEAKDEGHPNALIKEGHLSPMPDILPTRTLVARSRKKLLVLDVNGLLVDIVDCHKTRKPDLTMSKRKAVFKRQYCDEFLEFCFDRFNVAVWSSRTKKNLDKLIDFLFGDSRRKLVFCWDQSHCTKTGCLVPGNPRNVKKPLVLKELRKLWEKSVRNLPWEKGEYDETNTLLLDDSPYKALRNPANTAIFPATYRYNQKQDKSLGPAGGLRNYLERLAKAENVQRFVERNPFGKEAITASNPLWNFYRKIIGTDETASKS